MTDGVSGIYRIACSTDLYIILVDNDDGERSLTNSAPDVILDLQRRLSGGIGMRRVFYRDSTRRYDQLLVEKGTFSGFAPCSQEQQHFFDKLITKLEY